MFVLAFTLIGLIHSGKFTHFHSKLNRITHLIEEPLCRNGKIRFRSAQVSRSPCYFFSSDMKSWHDALEDCVSKASNLMSIQDIHDSSIFWIGLNDVASEGNWEWSDGTSLKTPTLSFHTFINLSSGVNQGQE
uniref:C-type lectin domain-containing protein n=1 Tax=Sinocyclocheilus rhinocerous TaxID=307959 RepID=A0A673L6Y0_9TELE